MPKEIRKAALNQIKYIIHKYESEPNNLDEALLVSFATAYQSIQIRLAKEHGMGNYIEINLKEIAVLIIEALEEVIFLTHEAVNDEFEE